MNDNNQWVNQPEDRRFLKNALALQGSVTPKVFKKVLIMVVYSALISYLYHFIPAISLPIGPFEYAGLVMGLILVFRVNSGYDRWWEARKIWGTLVNQSRNLAIIVSSYPKAYDRVWVNKVTNYIAAFPYVMKNSLRGNSNLHEISHLLDGKLLSILEKASHKPSTLSSLIASELQSSYSSQAGLDSFAFLQAEEKRGLILDCQGACERIVKTPMPFVMAIKTRRFILLFLIALPFALVSLSFLICPLISGLVAYALFSLDQIGFELQNPFSEEHLSHLPLNDICKTIEENIHEISDLRTACTGSKTV